MFHLKTFQVDSEDKDGELRDEAIVLERKVNDWLKNNPKITIHTVTQSQSTASGEMLLVYSILYVATQTP